MTRRRHAIVSGKKKTVTPLKARKNPSVRDPLVQWQSSFGRAYIERNQAEADATREAAAVFDRILRACRLAGELASILEVGANVGINLIGLRRVLGPRVTLAALEPNAVACAELRKSPGLDLEKVFKADVYRIPAPNDSYDMVFTNGVLIHIPPDRLRDAMQEIVRVARRFVLCSEYFSHVPQEVPYHGHAGLLWKRDFGRTYLDGCSRLKIVDYGFIWQQEFPHFDDLNWWMFRKEPAQGS